MNKLSSFLRGSSNKRGSSRKRGDQGQSNSYNLDNFVDAERLIKDIMQYHNVDEKYDLLDLIQNIYESLRGNQTF